MDIPRMIDKITQSTADTMSGIKDGSIVLLSGFGTAGQPNALLEGLIEQGANNLTVAANSASVRHVGLARLMELGRVRKIICSFPRSSDLWCSRRCIAPANEIVPQGTGRADARRRRRHARVLHRDWRRHENSRRQGNRDINGCRYILEHVLKDDFGLGGVGSRSLGGSDV
jgi:3-oxoadipate CoA-transferase alpha subunit